jgi:hypothetical protein
MRTQWPGDSRSDGCIVVSAEQRHEMIAVAAYLRAEHRGFSPGREVEDWYEAATAVDSMLEGMRARGITHADYERVGLRNALRLWTG